MNTERCIHTTKVIDVPDKTKTAKSANVSRPKITFERTFRASMEEVWELWTTKGGLEMWWGPEGFTTAVSKLDLRPGGEFEYAMTATSPDAVEAMKSAGLSLTSVARGRYAEITPRRRLAYVTVADFIPGIAPYEVAAVVEIHPASGGVRMVVTEDAMHDDLWTQRSMMGMNSSLDRLTKVLDARHGQRRAPR